MSLECGISTRKWPEIKKTKQIGQESKWNFQSVNAFELIFKGAPKVSLQLSFI